MRIYSGLNEAHSEIMRDLLEVGEWIHGYSVQDQIVEGDKAFDFMELSPYAYMLSETNDLDSFTKRLELNGAWIQAEFEERVLGGFNPGEAWKLRGKVWKPFIQRGGTFAYTYSQRLHWQNQLSRIVEELAFRPTTRQAVITIYQSMPDACRLGGARRIPCSMFYQFMTRNGALSLHYVMRSCDFFTHFPYDQILAIKLQRYVAALLDLEVGIFTHFITSLHAFRKDFPEEVF